jgi:short-subunit dehydrogenase
MDAIGIWGATVGRGSGIGNDILRRLASDGSRVIYVFGRSEDKLRKLMAENPKVRDSFTWDIASEDKSEPYQDYLVKNEVKTLICTVGTGIGDPLPFLAQKDMTAMVMSNLVVPSMIMKYSMVPMKKLKGGRIIMFGSIVSFRPFEGASGYVGTKAGLRGMIEATRSELGRAFPEVSIHAIYTTTVAKLGLESVANTVLYLTGLPFGTHADIILDR